VHGERQRRRQKEDQEARSMLLFFFSFRRRLLLILTLLQLRVVGLFVHSQDAVVVSAHGGEGEALEERVDKVCC
jgi:hypothetical protein